MMLTEQFGTGFAVVGAAHGSNGLPAFGYERLCAILQAPRSSPD